MKTFLRLGFLAIAFVFVFNSFAVTEAKAQNNTLNQILQRMEEHRKSLQTLKADVTMVKYNPQLEDGDTVEGNVVYIPGKSEKEMYMRLSWTKPVQEELSVIKGEYMVYRKRLGQAFVGKVSSAKGNAKAGGALSFMSMSKEQLKANYSVEYLGEEQVKSGAETWHLKLTPKTANNYKGAELWVDGNGMPVQAKVIENNGDSTTVLLTNLHKNETVNAKSIAIILPKGIKPIKG
ncbi:MAG: outer membrane lipoprotein carrier protein LolA [Acidobacteriota bacterium]|nr:outer membrane lipoprotein carrier protein LolA [Acidobacteriota bacterium]